MERTSSVRAMLIARDSRRAAIVAARMRDWDIGDLDGVRCAGSVGDAGVKLPEWHHVHSLKGMSVYQGAASRLVNRNELVSRVHAREARGRGQGLDLGAFIPVIRGWGLSGGARSQHGRRSAPRRGRSWVNDHPGGFEGVETDTTRHNRHD